MGKRRRKRGAGRVSSGRNGPMSPIFPGCRMTLGPLGELRRPGEMMMVDARLRYPLLLSILAALLTLGLKTTAYLLTGSVGLLSDAAESIVNLAAALVAYFSLRFAARPVDANHTYGHEKIEYFSSGLEGGLILVA